MHTPPLTLPLTAADVTLAQVGGKGLNLARLARAGLPVPDGFLITTAAYRGYVAANGLHDWIVATADSAEPTTPAALTAASAAIRARFTPDQLPADLRRAILAAYPDPALPVAVRSSATAEDLPDLSFAGQQDTFLNVVGAEALLAAVVACWGSLWTARAIGYRARNDIPHRDVALAVVVQRLVPATAAGVLFTANPLTCRRDETVIDATLGLGEALVAGQVEPDHYVVAGATGAIRHKTLGAKGTAVVPVPGGGTTTTHAAAGATQALPDAVIIALAALGRRVAALYDTPQDIEWAWTAPAAGEPPGGTLALLQSRPITSLYPLPDGMQPDPLRVMFSFGSVQGVLEPLTPLGQDLIKALLAGVPRVFDPAYDIAGQDFIFSAGERLWIDFAPLLRRRAGRFVVTRALGFIDPIAAEAVRGIVAELPLQRSRPSLRAIRAGLRLAPRIVLRLVRALRDPDRARARLQATAEALVDTAGRAADAAADVPALAEQVEQIGARAFPTLLPHFVPLFAASMAGLTLVRRAVGATGGGGDQLLLLTRGLPHNVTTEMDLALWQTAQALQADGPARAALEGDSAESLADATLARRLPPVAQHAVDRFLDRYGMRGLGEIDLGRPRWRERPTQVWQVLQSYARISDPQRAPDAVFSRSSAEAAATVAALTTAVRRRPLGRVRARLVTWGARRLRALAGLRETPKFTVIRVMGVLRARLLAAGAALAADGVLAAADDIFYLHTAELAAGEAAPGVWRSRVADRRATARREQRRRQLPRILLSDGRAFYESRGATPDAADGVLSGSPVSPGVVEGRAHVILDPAGAQLAPGDILVCPGTDPAWTPLFLAAGGLVMEVGGVMTHGSVVAREYGIPAVVGVADATRRLHTGQRIRVDGTTGHVTLLADEAAAAQS